MESGWKIDTSTGSRILTYNGCSVIQDEQADEVMALLGQVAELEAELAEIKAERDALRSYRKEIIKAVRQRVDNISKVEIPNPPFCGDPDSGIYDRELPGGGDA